MARKKSDNQADNTVTCPDPVPAAALPVKKRGRPKGSTNKVKTVRKDMHITTEPGENTKYLNHDLRLMNLPKINVNNPLQVKQRINEYFQICAEDDIKPSVASFALSFGIGRSNLFLWLTGKSGTIKNPESLDTLKSAYDTINSYYEHMMNNGKINPVAGIFLMKNNLGYKDTTDYVISANNNQDPTLSDITEKAGLLSD